MSLSLSDSELLMYRYDYIVTAYTHSPLPGPDYIRILTLHPAAQTREAVNCNVSAEPLDGAAYVALSYTWGMNARGDVGKTRAITIEGVQMLVTQNLLEGLQRIRNPSEPLRLWIDAVCINQTDLEEQSAQVARMDKIYANASSVIVWLGEGSTETEDRAMFRLFKRMEQHDDSETQDQLASCLYCCLIDEEQDCGCSMNQDRSKKVPEASPRNLDNEQLMRSRAEQPLLDSWISDRLSGESQRHKLDSAISACEALNAFLSRRYWKRRWILQELFHSKTTDWYWGPCRMRFQGQLLPVKLPALVCDLAGDARTAMSWIASARDAREGEQRLDGWNPGGHPEPDRDLPKAGELYRMSESVQRITAPGFGTLLNPRKSAQSAPFQLGKKLNMSDAMLHFNESSCFEPRDRVIAIASLCTPRIQPNYEVSVAEVYTQAARAMINDGQIQRILHNFVNEVGTRRVWWQEPDPAPPDLPFWVPDFRKDFGSGSREWFGSGEMVPVRVSEGNVLGCEAISWGVVKRVQEYNRSGNIIAGIDARITLTPHPDGRPLNKAEKAQYKPKANFPFLRPREQQYCYYDWRASWHPQENTKTRAQHGDVVCSFFPKAPQDEVLFSLRPESSAPGSYVLVDILRRSEICDTGLGEKKRNARPPSFTAKLAVRILPSRRIVFSDAVRILKPPELAGEVMNPWFETMQSITHPLPEDLLRMRY